MLPSLADLLDRSEFVTVNIHRTDSGEYQANLKAENGEGFHVCIETRASEALCAALKFARSRALIAPPPY